MMHAYIWCHEFVGTLSYFLNIWNNYVNFESIQSYISGKTERLFQEKPLINLALGFYCSFVESEVT